MLIAVSAILLVLGILAYRKALFGQVSSPKEKGQSQSRHAEVADIGLLVLRLLILLLFAAVLVGAVFTRVWIEKPRRVAVMLDVSQSMSAVGAESAASSTAEAFPLPAEASRQLWEFGDTAKTIVDFRLQIADSQTIGRTRIGAALKTAGKTRPGAVVLLSDGQDNGEDDAVAAARGIGVPVYTVGFGGAAKRNARVEQVLLPAIVYSGDTVLVQVRVSASGFANERARLGLRAETREIVLGQSMAEQDVPFRLVFDRPGRQVIEARLDSLAGESDYADNRRSVTVDVKPGRVRVAYVTNRPSTDTRMMLRALSSDERIEVIPNIAVTGSLTSGSGTMNDPAPDVFILDDVVETGSSDVWQTISDRVRAGAGILVLAGPDFQPGQRIGTLLKGTVGRAQTGTFTPELTEAGGVLPWFGRDVFDAASVPPFAGVRPLETASLAVAWLKAQENGVPLMVAGKAGRGKLVYVAGYPLWRWGFGPEEKPEQATPFSSFLDGVVRYLSERDTSPFWLDVSDRELYRGQSVRLLLKAVAADGRPWAGLGAIVRVVRDTQPKSEGRSQKAEGRGETVAVPMTETGSGVYEATIEALEPGRYRAIAAVSLGDTSLGRATTDFAVAEQAIELANTGMNEGLLRAIAEASGGRFFTSDSLPREGAGITLGSYQRRFTFDPRRAVWAYVLIALLAGAEWLLRRRRGML